MLYFSFTQRRNVSCAMPSLQAAAREDVSFRYTAEQGKTVTVTAKGAGPGTSQKTGRRNVTLYTTDNGYQYYTDTTSSGVTP